MKQENFDEIMKLKVRINKLRKEIDECKEKIDQAFIRDGADFLNAYVMFHDGNNDNYIFMRVEEQDIAGNYAQIVLRGPSFTLDVNPLSDNFEAGDVSEAAYDEYGELAIGPAWLSDTSYTHIEKISADDFKNAVGIYIKEMRQKLIP